MTPTVLLPGTLCDERLFAAIMPGLAAPHFCDHRPFDRVAVAAEALIGEVPPGSVVIGFSLGGWIELEMLARWPERFAGAVLVSGHGFPDDLANASVRRDRVARARQRGLDTLIDDEMPLLVGTKSIADPEINTLIGAMAETSGHSVHARQAEMNIHRPDHRALLAECPVRMLVVAGEEDRLAPHARYVQAASAAHSRLVMLSGVGHFIPLEAPVPLLSAIRTIFADACA